MDDSYNDPDFVENETDSDCSDSSDESFVPRRSKSLYYDKGQNRQTALLTRSANIEGNYYTDYVPDSDDSYESSIVPDFSVFLVGKSLSTSPVSQSVFSNGKENGLSRFGLLPKKSKKVGCKQVYDKVNYCTYCEKAISSKISRHLLTVHKSETRVRDILCLSKRSKPRMLKLEELANEGNFKHNLEVLRKKEGYFVVGRRENKVREYHGNYLPCDMCKKFILKKTLWLHHKNCAVGKYMNESNGTPVEHSSTNAVRLSRQLLKSALMEDVDPCVSRLLSRMNHDEITEVFQQDDLIKMYAALKVESLGRDQDQKINDIHRVSQSCRTLARLVIRCRKQSGLELDINQLISPTHFDLVVSATKSLCLDNEKSAPSLGKLMGNNLSHIIQVKKGAALRKGEDQKLQEAENFKRLFTLEWNFRVNSVFQKMTNTINRQKVKTIPLTEDLQKLRTFVLSSMHEASTSLQKNGTSESWSRLAKLTLCRLILFNKRRRAEVKDLKLGEFETRPNWQEEQSGEFKMALSTSDKLLAER